MQDNIFTETISEFAAYAAKQKALSERLKSAIEEAAAGELGIIDYVLLSGDISEELRRAVCFVGQRLNGKRTLPLDTIVVIIQGDKV